MSILGFLPSLRLLRAARLTPEFLALTGLPLDHTEIPTAERFVDLSVPANDLVANGRVAKFLIDLRPPAPPRVHFINGNFTRDGQSPEAAKYHYLFAQQVLSIPDSLEEFNRVTYFTQPKTRYIAGNLHTYFLDGASEPIYGLQFYPQDVVRETDILDAVRGVRERITIRGAHFAFVPTGSQQTTATVRPQLEAATIDLITLDRVLGSIRYIPLNTGEAWGFMRIFPSNNDELNPADIPVFDELPLDLSVVAGVVTKAVQDSNSHINLKSKERGTPNMVLRTAGPDDPRLTASRDKPIHFTVRADDFFLEASTDEVVAARLAERNNRPWIALVLEPETLLRSFDDMAAGTAGDTLAMAARYGSKSTNIGFLTHRSALGRRDQPGTPSQRLGYDLVPRGFGVPLSYYNRLLKYAPNSTLRTTLVDLIAAEKGGTLSSGERARWVEQVQQLFLNARFPPEDLARIKARLLEVLPGIKKIKVRSSANAEDVPNFDGAGLHDSFAATVDKEDEDDESCRIETEAEGGNEVKRKVKPKSVACGIKGVYASLWNKRAIEERTFARIDHDTAAMGLAIVPAYDFESDVESNAVVITRVLNTTGVYGYTLSLQEGNNLVTNPDRGTYSETTIAALGIGDEPTSLTVLRYAKPTPDGLERTQSVLPREKTLLLVDLARAVERAYCTAKPSYYEGDCDLVGVDSDKPKCLDMEIKVLQSGHFVFKQVREFAGK